MLRTYISAWGLRSVSHPDNQLTQGQRCLGKVSQAVAPQGLFTLCNWPTRDVRDISATGGLQTLQFSETWREIRFSFYVTNSFKNRLGELIWLTFSFFYANLGSQTLTCTLLFCSYHCFWEFTIQFWGATDYINRSMHCEVFMDSIMDLLIFNEYRMFSCSTFIQHT